MVSEPGMQGWLRHLLLVLLPAWPLAAGAGEPDAVAWLERMTQSLHSQSYTGTFILQRGERIDTIRVVHAAEDGGYREKLQTLTGSAREVIRSVDRLSALKGALAEGEGGTQAAPPWPPAIAASLLGAREHYHLKSPGYDRIAGLPCFLLHAKARDGYRYSHRYCLHDDTGLPLLSELIDSEGQLLERLVFTELEFLDVVFEDALKPGGCGARHIEVRAGEGELRGGESGGEWYFEALPPGFVPVAATERAFAADSPPSLHFVLSDGLATVSVYVDTLGKVSEVFEGATSSGATNAVARPLAGHQLTVVGEVPPETVEWIAGSTRHRPEPAVAPGNR
jgi:sigma-E factor negative regulatory protein RseB